MQLRLWYDSDSDDIFATLDPREAYFVCRGTAGKPDPEIKIPKVIRCLGGTFAKMLPFVLEFLPK